MLRPIGWAQLYYGETGGRTGAKNDLETFAIYSFSTLKLKKVFLKYGEATAYIKDKELTKVILVRYVWKNNPANSGHKRAGHTPMRLAKRCKFSDTRKSLEWNRVEGIIPEE